VMSKNSACISGSPRSPRPAVARIPIRIVETRTHKYRAWTTKPSDIGKPVKSARARASGVLPEDATGLEPLAVPSDVVLGTPIMLLRIVSPAPMT